ncbi:MAG: 6-carboxytetrahydropterin synthase [Desulfurellales bacterium]|nr:MAG: 6-carboxytetrahydropterin synthase [Desulfurellales bacterium]
MYLGHRCYLEADPLTVVRISKEIGIDAGHRVPNHESKCRNPHGHRYRVIVHAEGPIITEPGSPDEGMLVDFAFLKQIMMQRVDAILDHGFIVYEGDHDMLDCFTFPQASEWKIVVFPYIPTAENIARWIWEQINPDIATHFRGNLKLVAVEIWETPTSMAIYEGKEVQ